MVGSAVSAASAVARLPVAVAPAASSAVPAARWLPVCARLAIVTPLCVTVRSTSPGR
ncbi:MAG: hypothetical protein WDO24_00185 [Pseudomonadota bacterium]